MKFARRMKVNTTPEDVLRRCASSCKWLDGKTVWDVISTPEFLENLGKYFEAQKEDYKAAAATFKATARRFQRMPAHAITHFLDMSTEAFRDEFCRCLAKRSIRPCAQREYVEQLGMQAYNITVANAIVAEFPETKDILFPTTNKN